MWYFVFEISLTCTCQSNILDTIRPIARGGARRHQNDSSQIYLTFGDLHKTTDGSDEPVSGTHKKRVHTNRNAPGIRLIVSQQNGLNVRHILLRTHHHNATHSKWHFYLITAFRRLVRLILMRWRWGQGDLSTRVHANAVTKIVCCFFVRSLHSNVHAVPAGLCVCARECSPWHLKYTNALRMLQIYSEMSGTKERLLCNANSFPSAAQHGMAEGCAWIKGVGSAASYYYYYSLFFSRSGRMNWQRAGHRSFSCFCSPSHHGDDFYLILFTLVACVAQFHFGSVGSAMVRAKCIFGRNHFIPLIRKWWCLKAFYSCPECDFGKCAHWTAGRPVGRHLKFACIVRESRASQVTGWRIQWTPNFLF